MCQILGVPSDQSNISASSVSPCMVSSMCAGDITQGWGLLTRQSLSVILDSLCTCTPLTDNKRWTEIRRSLFTVRIIRRQSVQSWCESLVED